MGFFDPPDRGARDSGGRDRGDLGPPPDPFRIDRSGEFRSPIPLRWVGLVAAMIVLFLVLNVGKSIYVDALWFRSVDYGGVFRTVVIMRVGLFVAGALIAAAALGVNIWIARRVAPRGIEESFIEDVDPEAIRRLALVALIAATLFFATVFGAVAAGSWETLLLWWNAQPFGLEDPAFNRDVSFYLFDLPALHFLQGWILGLLFVSALAAGAVYALSSSLQRFTLTFTSGMRLHLSVLAGLALITLAAGTYLSIFDLASSGGGIVAGATYADMNARVPARWILTALGVFAGLAVIANGVLERGVFGGYRVPAFALGIWGVGNVIGNAIYPAAIQSLDVNPNELEKERTYIARNIEFTRRAFGLDQAEVINYPASAAVTADEIEANPDTIGNIRLLDPRPLRDTFTQIQSIRPLYAFHDIDIDRYAIDGEQRQVMLSARELNLASARQQADSGWTRERLQLTHGFGAVVAPVNEVTSEGLPELFTRDIPPVSDILPISEEGSRVYFGELTNHYIVVNTNVAEFDYPSGEQFVETTYTEDRGIAVGNFIQRLALAWELGDGNLLISGQIGSDSRVLMHRSLTQRVEKLAPFLTLDPDPYLVIIDGRLMWIQDAYTTTSHFPYSQPQNGINYIRNSVKITMDALTGDLVFYLMDPNDPIISTWAEIFPSLFTPAEAMPEAMQAHIRYPEYLFQQQALQYLAYHVTDPQVFFVGEDFWNIPTERVGNEDRPVDPYYVMMTLPGEDAVEFALIEPFNPRNRQNTIAWMAGRSDGDDYGKLRVYRFPTEGLVYGPAQIEARINQDPRISAQLTLWSQAGSDVFRGNLLMIPIGTSFLYVEPIYLQSQGSRLPELKRVVIANGNSIAMESTVDRALDVLFGRREPSGLEGVGGGGVPVAPTPEPTATPGPLLPSPSPTATLPADLEALLEEARDASDAAQAELDRLRAILDAIEQSGGAQP